jgi:hypothetical protein
MTAEPSFSLHCDVAQIHDSVIGLCHRLKLHGVDDNIHLAACQYA